MFLVKYLKDPSTFIEEKEIGEGNFSSVFLVHQKGNKEKKYALKKIPYDSSDHDLQLHFIREIMIMANLNHPSLVKLEGFSFPSKKEQECKIYSKYMPNKTLHEILKKEQYLKKEEKILTPTHKSIIVYGIVSAMNYLHHNNIVHRDLKPENIFLDDNYYPVLSDFGLSRFVDSTNFNMTGRLGTPYYMAPELFNKNEKKLTNKVDVYAFAVTLLSLFTINYKFPGEQPSTIRKLISFVQSGKRYKIPNDAPEFYMNLINDCWSNDIEDRPTFKQILENLEENDEFIFEGSDKEKVHEYMDYIKKFDDSIKMNESSKSVSSDDENDDDIDIRFEYDDEYEETEDFDFKF